MLWLGGVPLAEVPGRAWLNGACIGAVVSCGTGLHRVARQGNIRCKQLCSRNGVYISKGEEYGTDIVPASLKIVLIEVEVQTHDVYVCPHRSTLKHLRGAIQGRSSRKSIGEKLGWNLRGQQYQHKQFQHMQSVS